MADNTLSTDMPTTLPDPTDRGDQVVKKPRMLPAEVLEAVQLRATGMTYKAIGEKLHRNEETISLHVAQFEDSSELARKWLTGQALVLAQAWTEAAMVSASKGRHEGAKDALLHGRVIEPVADASPKTGIVINVGNGSQPIQDVSGIPTVTVIETQRDSSTPGH